MTDFAQIQKLVELFNPKVNDSKSDTEEEDVLDETSVSTNNESITANNSEQLHTAVKKSQKKTTSYSKIEQDESEKLKACEIIDPDDELAISNQQSNQTSDWRKSPQWDIAYRQQVTPTDVFLQMGGKGPSTASCEDMILSVHLPGESRQNIDLKVTPNRLHLVSPNFRLDTPLPHPVDPQRGNAQWDKNAEKLIITLTMDREFDYINF